LYIDFAKKIIKRSRKFIICFVSVSFVTCNKMFDVVVMQFSDIQRLYFLARVLIKWKINRNPVNILSHLSTECWTCKHICWYWAISSKSLKEFCV